MKTRLLLSLTALAVNISLTAQTGDPRLDSWSSAYAGKYARVYTNAAAQTARHAATTWSNGTQTQSLPAYCGVQEVYSSSNWVYLRSTGLGSHIMGPWSAGFPNLPANGKVLYRLPRTPAVPATKTATGLGAIGYFVDGVAMFDSRDGFVWTGSSESGSGTGYWNRDAYVNESATFDPAYAHQEQTGTYHYHANPIALRYLLGDHVDYNSATQTYSESTNAAPNHSPLLGFVCDGFPLYGPYGYANATNPVSGVRRLISGFVLRNGQSGTQNLTLVGRTNIPAWAVRLYGVAANQSGPNVSGTYPLGRYMEDNDYLGDLGKSQGVDFDLDEYNGRFCVTPEFPGGTYAYFVSIASNGTPVFPYNIGRGYYGSPTGGKVTSISETITTNLVAGPNAASQLQAPTVDSGTVTLVWSSAEGGSYRLDSTPDLGGWTTRATNIAAQGASTQLSTNEASSMQFYRVVRTGLASYDPVSGTTTSGGGNGLLSVSPVSAARGSTFTLTINLDPNANPAPPPQNAPINSVTVGSISGASNTHVSQTQVTSSITIPANAGTGTQTVSVVFPGPPNNPTQTVTYTLANGFSIK